DGHAPPPRRREPLHRLTVLDREDGGPDLVTGHDLGERSLQRSDVEWPAPAHRDRLVVDGDVGRDLRVQPDLALGPRQRGRGAGRTVRDRIGGARAIAAALEVRFDEAATVVIGRGNRPAHQTPAAPKATGSAVRPRKPRVWRQTSGPGSSWTSGRRRSMVSSTTGPSMRATRGRTQKAAARA